MALVKTSDLPGKAAARLKPAIEAPRILTPAKAASSAQRRAQGRSKARQEKAAERIAAATEELSSGIGQAAAASEELHRSLGQIASAAEEAAGAAHQSLTSITSLGSVFTQARDRADLARRKTDALQTQLTEAAAQIDGLVTAVQDNAARQLRSVEIVATLERQAANIGEISETVGDISDQTSLLALNAAIEAARAGEHGRGFAVVADEVRAFAETSEKSAREVRGLADAIGGEVRGIAARIKTAAALADATTESGRAIITELGGVRAEMGTLAQSAEAILTASIQAEGVAREAQRGAEQVASAAEEQSAATAEAQRAVAQQSTALDQSAETAQALAALAERLQESATVSSGAEQVAGAAEELSSTVQQLSGAASQILVSADQIRNGAQQQAAAAQESSGAIAQIEGNAKTSRDAAARSVDRIGTLIPALKANRDAVNKLSRSVSDQLQETRAVIGLIASLEESSRRIDKIVGGIALVAVQTNMLAVTGSVEAARAGEFGRGFAVVSADIRNLAGVSAENAERVKDVVRLIQDQIASVRRDLEKIEAFSQAEIGRNQAILERLDTIEADMSAISAGAGDILRGSDLVLQSVRDVLKGTEQIAAAAEQTSGAGVQAAGAARQQAQGAEALAAAIEEIASLADELHIAES